MPEYASRSRTLVDLTGPFFQVITVVTVEDLNEWETFVTREMDGMDFAAWLQSMMECTEGSSREFYTIGPVD